MRVLVTGASGQLGAYLLDALSRTPLEVIAWSGRQPGIRCGYKLEPVDLAQVDQLAQVFRRAQPDVVVHTAAISSIADCFRDPGLASSVNVRGTAMLAELSLHAKARFVYVSTDLVFDGTTGSYRELDTPSPLSLYGRSKARAEELSLEIPNSAVVRVSLLYGPAKIGRPSFFDQQLAAIRNQRQLRLFEDEWRTPLGLVTAAQALISVARSDFLGILHIGGPERVSRYEMGLRFARYFGLDATSVIASKQSDASFDEPRPRDCSLDCTLWRSLFPDTPWPNIETELNLLYPGSNS